VDDRARHPVSKRLDKDRDAQTIARYSDPAWVLDGWSPAMAPVILRPPAPVTAAAWRPVIFTVGVAAIPAATYQWFRNGVAIPGATGKTLALEAVRPADAGRYTVTVTNASGTTTSRPAALTVK
jgi:hypothetical protein